MRIGYKYDKVLDKMEFTGGSFVSSLAVAMRHADVNNFNKLMDTFEDYWIQYENEVIVEENAELLALTRRRDKELRTKIAVIIHNTLVDDGKVFDRAMRYAKSNPLWSEVLGKIVDKLQEKFIIEDANNDDELSEIVKKSIDAENEQE